MLNQNDIFLNYKVQKQQQMTQVIRFSLLVVVQKCIAYYIIMYARAALANVRAQDFEVLSKLARAVRKY